MYVRPVSARVCSCEGGCNCVTDLYYIHIIRKHTPRSAGGWLTWTNLIPCTLPTQHVGRLVLQGLGDVVCGGVVAFCAHKQTRRWGGEGDDCSGWVHHQGHGPKRPVSTAVTLHRHKQATWSLTAWQTRLRGISAPLLTRPSIVFPSLILFKPH